MSAADLERYLIPLPGADPGGGGGFAVLARAAGGSLVELSLFALAAAARAAEPDCVELRPNGPPPLLELRQQLAQYFAGERREFALPLEPRGTEFERRVWQALMAIPYGETRSYAEVAAAIGRPSACRAVGRANGSNPIAVVIPCHRVIGSDGSLTGYGGGLPLKRLLLDLESGNGAASASGAAQRPLPLAP
jgi:methylated-DNA-[protein]-cysteine S-methyltransferase